MAADLLIGLGITGGLLGVGYVVGSKRERTHLESLDKRENDTSHMLVTDLKSYPLASPSSECKMYVGQVVIATDYFKSMMAGLKTIVGGQVSSYETLVSRARRESLQRLKEQARADGYNAVCNIRYETSNIASSRGNKGMAAVEMLCSGTAYHSARAHRV